MEKLLYTTDSSLRNCENYKEKRCDCGLTCYCENFKPNALLERRSDKTEATDIPTCRHCEHDLTSPPPAQPTTPPEIQSP